jgi:hypothetical protein
MKAVGWRRSIRGIGGYWQGEFTLYGDEADLAQFFYSHLGGHIEEYSGGHKTWEGMIYEMELTTDGTSRRRSFDSMFNHVRVRYINTDNEILLTDAVTNDASILAYGQKEMIWPLDGQDQTPAEAVRDSLLADFAWPRGRTNGTTLGTIGKRSLFVRVCGYSFTANWEYESVGDDTDDNLSTWIDEIITTDCAFLTSGNIRSNTLQVRKETRIEMRCWEVYFKREGGFYTAAGGHVTPDPWQVKPAVVRDMTYPIQTFEIDAWLEDARDWYMSEVDVWDNGDGTAKLIPKGEEFDESDILIAQEAYEQQMKRLKEREEQD